MQAPKRANLKYFLQYLIDKSSDTTSLWKHGTISIMYPDINIHVKIEFRVMAGTTTQAFYHTSRFECPH